MEKDNNRYRFEEEDNKQENSKEETKETVKEEKTETVKEEKTENSHEKKSKNDKRVEELKKQNEELNKQINNLKNEVLKVKADEINFKKHLEEDKTRMIKYANQSVLEKFVTQLDLFDKVVSMPTEDPVLKNYLIGFEMINNNLKQVLDEEGVKKIVVNVGDKMDPKFHHVLQTEWDETKPEDTILQILQTGYMYKDRVLRPTLIKVNKKEGK